MSLFSINCLINVDQRSAGASKSIGMLSESQDSCHSPYWARFDQSRKTNYGLLRDPPPPYPRFGIPGLTPPCLALHTRAGYLTYSCFFPLFYLSYKHYLLILSLIGYHVPVSFPCDFSVVHVRVVFHPSSNTCLCQGTQCATIS